MIATASFFLPPRRSCCPFAIDGVTVGLIRPDFAVEILRKTQVFTSDGTSTGTISFVPTLKTLEQRSQALAEVLQDWRKRNVFECLQGWRNETYWVTTGPFGSPAVLTLERAAVSIFGFRSFGCHLNGYTVHPVTGELGGAARQSQPGPTAWTTLYFLFKKTTHLYTKKSSLLSCLPLFWSSGGWRTSLWHDYSAEYHQRV